MKIRLLVITTLYPNQEQHRHGIFVETRLRHLLESGMVEAQVIAPVPWFPFNSKRFVAYSRYRDVPPVEQRHGITIYHPRYLVIPKIGMLLTPFFLAVSILLASFRQKKTGFTCDVLDAHYYYPDGVAVSLIAGLLRKPFTITARGTDINLIPEYKIPRNLILWAAKRASASITVSAALAEKMLALGAEKQKVHIYRNGVNCNFFKPLNRKMCREKWNIKGQTLLAVGNLIESKGHSLIIEALKFLTEYRLVIVGEGVLKAPLQAQVADNGLQDQVTFLGNVQQSDLVELYNAADALILASSREGMPNVLLESLACGTPVISTNVGGAGEVVKSPEAGLLLNKRTPEAIVEAVNNLFVNYPKREDTRKYAEQFSWDDTIEGLISLLKRIVS